MIIFWWIPVHIAELTNDTEPESSIFSQMRSSPILVLYDSCFKIEVSTGISLESQTNLILMSFVLFSVSRTLFFRSNWEKSISLFHLQLSKISFNGVKLTVVPSLFFPRLEILACSAVKFFHSWK